MKKKIFFTLFVLINTIFLLNEATSEANDFSVTVEKSEQQISSNSFFDLLYEPGTTYTEFLHIRNNRDEKMTVDISADSARTTEELKVDYSNKNKKVEVDKSLQYDLHKIISFEQSRYEIDSNASIKVPIKIDMPNAKFNGVLAGGILISEVNNEEATDKNFSINNTVSYEIAVLIRNNLNIENSKVEEKLNFSGFKLDKEIITFNIQNTTQNFINQIEMDINILEKTSGQNIYTDTKVDLQMAPNSSTVYDIPLPSDLTPQEYELQIKMKDYKNNNWEYQQDFNIDVASRIKNQITSKKFDSRILLYLLIALLLIIIMYMLLKNKQLKSKAR